MGSEMCIRDRALDATLQKRGMDVDKVIRLRVDDDALIARITNRFKEEGRKDDNPESFKIRLGNYNEQTAPLLPYYSTQGKLTEVDGMADIDSVAKEISGVLDGNLRDDTVKKPSFWSRIFGKA